MPCCACNGSPTMLAASWQNVNTEFVVSLQFLKGEYGLTMHLVLCRQLLLALAEWLCDHRETDERARNIVEGMHLFLLPTMNPDGFDRHQRGNIKQACLSGSAWPDCFPQLQSQYAACRHRLHLFLRSSIWLVMVEGAILFRLYHRQYAVPVLTMT